MYSTVGLLKHSKHSGKLIGTHQKLDRAARQLFSKFAPKDVKFPTYREIVYFEGMRGPDGLKRKSPGVDEPMHFILPDNDDGELIKLIKDHHHNLKIALKNAQNPDTADAITRAAFEAAWLAHALTDGLTPAHHFPYEDAVKELMSEKDYVKIFGQPIKGVMRGDTILESAKNNWKYWGVEGLMTKHIVFEYHVALIAARRPLKKLMPHLPKIEINRLKNYQDLDLEAEFYASLRRIHSFKMYERFRKKSWNPTLAHETREALLPEIVKLITIGWLSALPRELPDKDLAGDAPKNQRKDQNV